MNVKIIAAIQMTSSSKVTENLQHAAQLIKKAKQEHACIAVLPEMFPIIGHHDTDKLTHREQLGSGPIQDFLAEQAKTHGIWLIGGTIPIACNTTNKAYAASLVYNDQGQCIAQYNKIHLFDANLANNETYRESNTIEPGTTDENNIIVVDTPVGKIGLCVCYDIRFPELIRKLVIKGAEIIVAPAAFTIPTGKAHWQVLARATAIQSFCYFVGACQGGKHENGRETYGHSLIIEPWGTIIASIDTEEQKEAVITAPIDLNKVSEARKKVPVHEHRRL